jgi:hypothetical protein
VRRRRSVCQLIALRRLWTSLYEGNPAYPVSEPLTVVVGSWALDSLDREVCWETPTDDVGDWLGKTEEVEEDQKDGSGVRLPSLTCVYRAM